MIPSGDGRGEGRDDGRRTPSPDGEDGWIHIFVYGTLRATRPAHSMLEGCRRVAEASLAGTLYDLDEYPALVLYGETPVRGEVWRCPPELLWRLDEYEGTGRGLFRRVAVTVSDIPCWTWVAGPALAPQLVPDRRASNGEWRPRPRV